MTIDQRLEKLVERHEALAQSLELFQIESRENFNRVSVSLSTLADSLASLVRIVEGHERRIEALEG